MRTWYGTFIGHTGHELVNPTEREREFCSIKRGDVFLTRTSETMEDLKDYEFATFNDFTKRLRPKANIKIVPEYAGYFFPEARSIAMKQRPCLRFQPERVSTMKCLES